MVTNTSSLGWQSSKKHLLSLKAAETYFRYHIHQTNLLFGHHGADCLETCTIEIFFVFSMFHKPKKVNIVLNTIQKEHLT